MTLAPFRYKLGQGWGVQIVPLLPDGSEGQPFALTEAISDASDQSDQISDNSTIFAAPTARGSTPFGLLRQRALAPWALAESTDCAAASIFLPQGNNLDLGSADATARQIYSLSLDESRNPLCREIGANQAQSFRKIQAADTLPSMENVLFTNDSVLVDWFAQAKANKVRTDLRFLNYQAGNPPFTAQTVIAASYGLHQVLYETAVNEGYIDDRKVGLAPGDLFEPVVSLDLGTEFLATKFGQKGRGVQRQDYADFDDFQFQFAPALRGFNAGRPDFTVPMAQAECQAVLIQANFVYACLAIKNAPSFKPVPLGGGTRQ